MVLTAMNFLGVPYRRGGNSADRASTAAASRATCSRTASAWCCRAAPTSRPAAGPAQVPREELKPGDLVFFNTMRRAFSHVGIYVGDGKFIHAPRSGGEVRVEDMRQAYWSKRFNGARRARPPRAWCRPGPLPDRPRPDRGPGRAGTIAPWAKPSSLWPICATPRSARRADPADPVAPSGLLADPWAGRCATCASRSPTAATSAAATACPRRSSTATTVPAAQLAAELRGDHPLAAPVRGARRAQAAPDRRRAAAAQEPGSG
jgi:hypothetical protein